MDPTCDSSRPIISVVDSQIGRFDSFTDDTGQPTVSSNSTSGSSINSTAIGEQEDSEIGNAFVGQQGTAISGVNWGGLPNVVFGGIDLNVGCPQILESVIVFYSKKYIYRGLLESVFL